MYERSYNELITLKTYHERLEYLKLLDNNVTSPRHMSRPFYKSKLWEGVRDAIIKRDIAFDLALFGEYIEGPIFVHHINPIDENDIRNMTKKLLDPNNLVSTSLSSHNFIHYGAKKPSEFVERTPGDTILW